MAASYEFATGSVRVRENGLLTSADVEQMIAAPDEAAVAALLRDRGFGDPAAPADTVEELLRQKAEETWHYLLSVLPDPSVLDAFLLRNDLHNAKTLLKGVLGDRAVDDLLLSPTLTPPTAIRDAVKAKYFSELPSWLSESLATAYDILAESGDAQRADAVLDRAAMEEMLKSAENSGVSLLFEVVKATVFYADVKLALRAARAGMPESYLTEAICPCEGVDLYEWTRAYRGGEKELTAYLAAQNVHHCDEAMEAYRRSPVFFEKWVDDYLLSLARAGKTVTAGAEPLIGYLMAREAEDKAVRMVTTGLRTGQPVAELRERRRELYG